MLCGLEGFPGARGACPCHYPDFRCEAALLYKSLLLIKSRHREALLRKSLILINNRHREAAKRLAVAIQLFSLRGS